MQYSSPEPLRGKHGSLDEFNCGEKDLDEWLHKFAREAEAANTARTFVTTAKDRVVGFYSIAAGNVSAVDATVRVKAAQPEMRPIPVVVLARLAVDEKHQNGGVGRSLLMDALLRIAGASEAMGIRAVVVHAYGEAAAFYERYGFEPSPTDPLHLMLLMKDLKKFLHEQG
jgi:predicted N-acetyltransferase YhbS